MLRAASSTLFPYTTLFRSSSDEHSRDGNERGGDANCECSSSGADDYDAASEWKSTRVNSINVRTRSASTAGKKKSVAEKWGKNRWGDCGKLHNAGNRAVR